MVNDQGELLSFQLTAANTDDRKPVGDLTYSIFDQLFGDKGYIFQALFEQPYNLKVKNRIKSDFSAIKYRQLKV
ncbi:MAG: transposase [Cyanobacteria bacterium P01_G01_bin.39]